LWKIDEHTRECLANKKPDVLEVLADIMLQ
jgi:hypothetical protein